MSKSHTHSLATFDANYLDLGGKPSRLTRQVATKKKRDDDGDYDDDIGKDVRPYNMSRMAHGKRHFPSNT